MKVVTENSRLTTEVISLVATPYLSNESRNIILKVTLIMVYMYVATPYLSNESRNSLDENCSIINTQYRRNTLSF